MTADEQRVVVVRDDASAKGTQAQTMNINAGKAVAETVRTTLGPAGMDKMMVDTQGSVIVTNDGATILRELDVAHPGAKMIIEMAKIQESVCYDGTTSTVVLGGQLLANSEQLFAKGLHPNVICRGFHQASKWAVEHARGLPNGSTDLSLVAKTAMTGKSVEHSLDTVGELCVNAVQNCAGQKDRIRVIGQPGGALEQSYLFNGIILHKEFVLDAMPKEGLHHVLLINGGLMPDKGDDNTHLHLNSATEAISYRQRISKDDLLVKAQAIINAMPGGGVVFVRDGISDVVCSALAKHGIAAVRRLQDSEMEALSQLLGISIAHDADDIEGPGLAKEIREEVIGDMKFVVVECTQEEASICTLVLRGATRQTLDETERGFEDALGVVSLAHQDGQVIPGGGSAYISMAQYLRQRSAEMGGREQMAVEAFAEALEIIPATIAENAGHDPLDTILALRNDHQNGNDDYGPDIESGGTCSMSTLGVFEPLVVVTQAVQSATEVAISILRIDDIISRRGDM